MSYGSWMNNMVRPMMTVSFLSAQGAAANVEFQTNPNVPMKNSPLTGGILMRKK